MHRKRLADAVGLGGKGVVGPGGMGGRAERQRFHHDAAVAQLGEPAGDVPKSERAAKETLALPIYPGLTSDQQEYVVDSIRHFYSNSNQ